MAESVSTQTNRAGTQTSTRRMIVTIGVVIFLTMLPVTMMVPVLREIVGRHRGASGFWSHMFMSANMIGAVVAAPVGGILADRMGRRKPILVAALILNSCLLWLMMNATSLQALLALRFFEGAAHIVALSCAMAMAADWSDPKRQGRTMGLVGSVLMFGTTCGAPIGGRLGEGNPLAVFHLGAAFSLMAAFIAWTVLRDAGRLERTRHFSDVSRLIKQHRALLVPYAYAFIDRFCVGVIVSSFVLFVAECHGMSPSQLGWLLSLFMFPFAVLCYPMGRLADRVGRVWMMSGGSFLFGIVYALYAVVPADGLPILMVASGVLSAMMFAPNLAICSDLAPGSQRASVYSGFNMAGSLGFLAGPLFGGTLLWLIGNRLEPQAAYVAVFALTGTTEVLCAAITLPYLRRLRTSGQLR